MNEAGGSNSPGTTQKERNMPFGFSKKSFKLVLLFTIIETITLVLWLILAQKTGLGLQVIAVVVLFVGLLFEHTLATNAGQHANDDKTHLDR